MMVDEIRQDALNRWDVHFSRSAPRALARTRIRVASRRLAATSTAMATRFH
jgi:hypothetical protein